jgi:hypothetical protein
MKKVVILALLMVSTFSFAQETKKESKWVIGAGVNFIDNTSSGSNEYFNYSNWNATLGFSKLSVQYYYNTNLSFSSEFTMNRLDKDVKQNEQVIDANLSYFGFDLNARYNVARLMKLPGKFAVEPILGLGNAWTAGNTNQSLNTGISLGYQINETYGVRLQTLGKFAAEKNTVGNNMIQHSLELYFKL